MTASALSSLRHEHRSRHHEMYRLPLGIMDHWSTCRELLSQRLRKGRIMIRRMDMRDIRPNDTTRSRESKMIARTRRQERALKASARSLEGPTALAGSR